MRGAAGAEAEGTRTVDGILWRVPCQVSYV